MSAFNLETLGAVSKQVERFTAPKVFSTPYATERKQFRFPRSKKRRIREKWVKRECNVRYEPRMFRIGETIYCHPTYYARLKQEFPEIENYARTSELMSPLLQEVAETFNVSPRSALHFIWANVIQPFQPSPYLVP